MTNNLVFPIIFVVALLNLPLVLIKSSGNHSLYFAITSIFVVAFFGSFLMYLTSQKELYPDWRRRLWYFPIFMAGSMGLSLSNTRAILLGLFNRRTQFLRTPKYKIESGNDHFVGKRYHGRARFSGVWAMLLMLYCFYTIGVCGLLRRICGLAFSDAVLFWFWLYRHFISQTFAVATGACFLRKGDFFLEPREGGFAVELDVRPFEV